MDETEQPACAGESAGMRGGCCVIPVRAVRRAQDDGGMPQNFIGGDREQVLLMPPSLHEWLPESHLAWFVLDAVEEMDLSAFYAAYRGDGVGRPAHDPAVMVALLVYAYARGQRSSRRIEQACVEDIAFRVITVNRVPDHTTIARFRQRHENAIAGLFSDVLRLCADAGLAGVGLVAVDGTKVHADASHHANRDYEQIAREILAEADAVDALEDEQFGDRRGDELPLELQTGRGRREWLRAGRRRLEAQRDADAKPIPASRPQRLCESKCRLEEELRADRRANEEYLTYRAAGVMSNGRRLGPSTAVGATRHAARKDQRHRSGTRATSRRRAATCRATTPRPSATSSRS